jgi:IS5 family transposase
VESTSKKNVSSDPNKQNDRSKKISEKSSTRFSQSSLDGFLEYLRMLLHDVLDRVNHKYQSTSLPHERHMVTTWISNSDPLLLQPYSILHLFRIIDLSPFELLLTKKYSSTKRRPPHPPLALFKALIFQRLRQISSWRKLAAILRSDRQLCVGLGFERAPAHDAFSEFTLKVGPEALDSIFRELVGQIRRLRPDFGEILAADSTLVRGYASPTNRFAISDPDARWGVKDIQAGKRNYIYGYKLHVVCDARYDIPVGYTITAANCNDSPQYPSLINYVAPLVSFRVAIADAGYDSKRNVLFTLKHKAAPIINLNPRRGGRKRRRADYLLPISRDSPEWEKYYSMRTSAERVFSRLKVELGLQHLKLRRLERVKVHFLLCLITMLLMALAAITTGHDELLRSIEPWRY